MVFEAPQELLRGIARALLAQEFERAQRIMRPQLAAQGFGQIGHGVPACRAMGIEPFQELREPIGRMLPKLELGLQLLRSLRLDVGQHETRLTYLREEANVSSTIHRSKRLLALVCGNFYL